MQKKLKILFITLPIVLVLIIGALIAAKRYITYGFIQNHFYTTTGLKLEFINPKTTFDYNLNMNSKADEINIYDKNKKILFVTVKNPDISLKPLSLLFKKPSINKLNAKEVTVNIKRDEKGNIDLINNLKEDINLEDIQKYSIKKLNSNIENINFSYWDDYIVKSKTSLILKNSDVKISGKKKSLIVSQKGRIETKVGNNYQISPLNISINSGYPLNNFNSDNLDVDIDVDNINLHILSDIAEKYISKDIVALSGNGQLNLKTIKNGDKNIQLFYSNFTNPSLKLAGGKTINLYKNIASSMEFSIDKDLIDINKLNISSQNLSILAKGEIIKPFSKKPKLDIETTITKTQLNNLLYLLPDDLIYYRPKGIPTLKKSNFHATLDGSIHLKLFPLDITGNMKASNVHIPNFPKPYAQNDVNFLFMKDKLRVYTRVYTPSNEYVIVDGISNLDNSLWGKYSVKSTKNIDLTYAQMYLVPIQQIIGFNIGPVPIMKITGMGNIDIKTQGTIKDAQIFGEFNARNATAEIEGLDAKLVNGSCRLVFDNRNLIFKEIRGLLDGANFVLDGIGNTKGEVDLNVKLDNAMLSKVVKLFNNSELSKAYSPITKNIAAVSGGFSGTLNLKGTISDYETKEFLNTLSPSGEFIFKNNKVILNNALSAKNVNGNFSFGQYQKGKFDLSIGNSKFNVEFDSKGSLAKISKGEYFTVNSYLNSEKIDFQDIIAQLKGAKFIDSRMRKVIKNFEDIEFYSKLNLKSSFKTNLNNFDIKDIKNQGYLIGLNSASNKNIKFNSGIINFNGARILFDNIDIDSKFGNLKLKGSDNNLNGNFSFLLNEDKADAIINPHLEYPVKVKGEIPIKGRVFGSVENCSVDFLINLLKNSDISFSGANIGDIELDRQISGRIDINKNAINLNNIKLSSAQTILKLSGQLTKVKDNIFYNNFKISTVSPMNVRILNIIFKKSILKKGNFECNLNLQGNTQKPKITGKINLFDLDIPLYDTQIHKIKANITDNLVDGEILAKNKESDLKVNFKAQNNINPPYIINKIYIESNKLNVADILESVKPQSQKNDIVVRQDFTVKPSDIIVKEGVFNFKDVVWDKITAQNLRGIFSYDNSIFKIKDIEALIAQGRIEGAGSYDMKTTKLNLNALLNGCEASILAKEFLNLNEQIFGKTKSIVKLSARHLNTPQGIKNVEAGVNFSIQNGKMTKLGSLEYLLRAGNLLKSGLLGLSLNNLIQILTPYKTGEFEKIEGDFDIKNGKIQDLEIASQGKNLSLYSVGDYDILNNYADIKIYGKLSKNVSNALGAVGNASIKQFIDSIGSKKEKQRSEKLQEQLDKIPDIEASQAVYFRASVLGDINKDNYTKEFKWE